MKPKKKMINTPLPLYLILEDQSPLIHFIRESNLICFQAEKRQSPNVGLQTMPVKFRSIEDRLGQIHDMSQVFGVKLTPRIFPSIYNLSNFRMARTYVKAEFACRRQRSPMHIC